MKQHIKALLATLGAITVVAVWCWLIITYPLTLTFVCVAALLALVYVSFYKHFKN